MTPDEIIHNLYNNSGFCLYRNILGYDEQSNTMFSSLLLQDQTVVAINPSEEMIPSETKFFEHRDNSKGILIMPPHLDVGSICGEPNHLNYGTREQLRHQAQQNGIGQMAVFPMQDTYFTQPDWISTLSKDPFFLPIASVSALEHNLYQLSDVGVLVDRGAIALHQQHDIDIPTLRKVFLYAKRFELPLFIRAGECSLEAQGVMREGNASIQLGYRGIPTCSENISISKICALLHDINIQVHISHVSTKRGIFCIKQAKEEGLQVTASCNIRNLIYCDDDILENPHHNEFHVMPPLGSSIDRHALQEALEQQILDGIMRDHQIIPQERKEGCFSEVQSGTTGFENVFSALYKIQKLHLGLKSLSFWKPFLQQPTQSILHQNINHLVVLQIST
jgi:dihydroorotase